MRKYFLYITLILYLLSIYVILQQENIIMDRILRFMDVDVILLKDGRYIKGQMWFSDGEIVTEDKERFRKEECLMIEKDIHLRYLKNLL